MVRRHLALSIALASILSMVAGGLAYAALTPNGKVTACVTTDGYVVTALGKNRCPRWTKPVLIDQSSASATPSPAGGGAVELVMNADPPDKSFDPKSESRRSGLIATVGTLTVPNGGGFYEIKGQAVSEIVQDGGCGDHDDGAEEYSPELRIIGANFASPIPTERGIWLDAGTYPVKLVHLYSGCRAAADCPRRNQVFQHARRCVCLPKPRQGERRWN